MKMPKTLKKFFNGNTDHAAQVLPFNLASAPEAVKEFFEANIGKPKNPYARDITDVAFDAVKAGDLETVKWFFALPVKREPTKQWMLIGAAEAGQYDVAKFILDSVPFKDVYANEQSKEAEEKAEEKGYTNIVSLIQERRALEEFVSKVTLPAPGKNF